MENDGMVQFPKGRVIEHITTSDTDLERRLCDLCEHGFTGVVRCTSMDASMLLLDGEVVAAAIMEGNDIEVSGDDAFASILKHAEKTDMAFEISELDVDQAGFSLKWYADIHGYENVTRKPTCADVKRTENKEREDLMERFGISEPDPDSLEDILKRAGIAYRMDN